jgi:hypothetical protein
MFTAPPVHPDRQLCKTNPILLHSIQSTAARLIQIAADFTPNNGLKHFKQRLLLKGLLTLPS